MLFDSLWTILLGIIGGIISSMIVSRVLLINSKYQEQIDYINSIIRKIGYISAYLQSIKTVFEVSFDEDIKIEKEMNEKGYKSEMEYYLAHKDNKWISVNDLIASFKREINRTSESIISDITNNKISEPKLIILIRTITKYLHDISSTKEYTFSSISKFKKKEELILEQYNNCLHLSGKAVLKQVFSDKIMIAMIIAISVLIIGTIVAKLFCF